MQNEAYKHLRFNFFFNVMDGAFFGFALGFASFTTIIPLFVSTMTSSAILIGMIPAIHSMGWQLPQLFMAGRISRLTHYKPITLLVTIHERLPFLGLVAVAWLVPLIGPKASLIATFMMLIWQGIGGGLGGNPWQNLIGKIIPADMRATFFGAQSAASNLLSAVGAILAGVILERYPSPMDFSLCFGIASIWLVFSWFCLYVTREPSRRTNSLPPLNPHPMWRNVLEILRKDVNFRAFLLCRMLYQFGNMAVAFYTVYAVRYYGMSETIAGVMTSLLLIIQVVANPLLGWVADKWNRKLVLEWGAIMICLSALMAWQARELSWFYAVYLLAGLANTAYWTIGLAFTLEFGSEAERPTYIGIANTLIAPATFLAPFFGGWLADWAGYPTTFLVSAFAGALTAVLLHQFVKDQRAPLEIQA